MGIYKWEHPSNYAGETFYHYYVGPGQSRDSDAMERSNFDTALEMLGDESDMVIITHSSHWAVGWVETILVHESFSTALITLQEIADSLECNSVLNEEQYDQYEDEGVNEYWQGASLCERIQCLAQNKDSIFAARATDSHDLYERAESTYYSLRG